MIRLLDNRNKTIFEPHRNLGCIVGIISFIFIMWILTIPGEEWKNKATMIGAILSIQSIVSFLINRNKKTLKLDELKGKTAKYTFTVDKYNLHKAKFNVQLDSDSIRLNEKEFAIFQDLTQDYLEFKPLFNSAYAVIVEGSQLFIPYRYKSNLGKKDLSKLTDTQLLLLTRSLDGIQRQQALEYLLGKETLTEYTAAFVIALCGEYVIEILSVIYKHIRIFDKPEFKNFIVNNPDFIKLQEARMVSYWNVYYRRIHPELQSYPGGRIFAKIHRLSKIT